MNEQKIKTVGIVVKPNYAEAWQTAGELAAWLAARDIKFFTEKSHENSNIETVFGNAIIFIQFYFELEIRNRVIFPILIYCVKHQNNCDSAAERD